GSSRSEGHLDETVLPHLEQALQDPAPLKLIIVHLLGAHPTYRFRYPASYSRFDGVEDEVTRGLTAQGRSGKAIRLRNQYDNVMLYSDHVLRQTLELCRKSRTPVAWLFSPDHGQDVAHYSDYAGHNDRVISMYEVPFLFWRSPGFEQGVSDLSRVASRPYQLDSLDNTLLGLMQIGGEFYDSSRDLFSPSFTPCERVVAGKPYP
ncbi:MAG TPA: sulfatase-like hydrolase/transferase, partial [Verrucomicrobiae bacterium]|nr:sulfatase-like hydrolase/transferase [Verrucomicrobiae bacterium]